MTSPEGGFDKFIEELESREAIKLELEATTQRYTDALKNQDVDVETPVNQIEISALAAQKLMLDEVILLNPNEPSLYLIKKQLQARSLIRGDSPAWQELIDQEFPGEPLKDDDIDVIANTFSAQLQSSEDRQFLYQKTQTEMLDHLALEDDGLVYKDLTDEDQAVLDYLIFIHNLSRLKPQDRLESTRAFLLNHGYTDKPAWQSLLDKFFSTRETGKE